MNNRTSRGFVSGGFEKMDFNHIDEGVQKRDIVLSPFSIEREDECDSSDMLNPLLVFSTCDDGCLYLCGGIASYYAYRKYARGRSIIVHTHLETLNNCHEVAVLTNTLESNNKRYLSQFKNGHPAIRKYSILSPLNRYAEHNKSRELCAIVSVLIHVASGEDVSLASINTVPYKRGFDEEKADILFGKWAYTCRELSADAVSWVWNNAYMICCMIIALGRNAKPQKVSRAVEVMYETRKGLFYDEKNTGGHPFARGVELIDTIDVYLNADSVPQPVSPALLRKLPSHTCNTLVRMLLSKTPRQEYMLRRFQQNTIKYGDVI